MTVASMIGSSTCLILAGSGNFCGLFDLDHIAGRGRDGVSDARSRGDQVDLKFALQPLLDNFKMQQAEKAASKAEAERGGIFGFES